MFSRALRSGPAWVLPAENPSVFGSSSRSIPDATHGTAIYADQARGGLRGQCIGIYGSPMERLGM